MDLAPTLNPNEITADIMAQGGGTYRVYPDGIIRENLTTGYMVSRYGRENVYIADNFASYGPDYIRDYVRENADMLNSTGFFLGAWVDDGYVYLDVSTFYVAQDAAEYHAKENFQLAYYDNANGIAVSIIDND